MKTNKIDFSALRSFRVNNYDETFNCAKTWIKDYLHEINKVDDKYKECIANIIRKFLQL